MGLWGLMRAKARQSCSELGLATNNLQPGSNNYILGIIFSYMDMNQSVPFGLGAQRSLALSLSM